MITIIKQNKVKHKVPFAGFIAELIPKTSHLILL